MRAASIVSPSFSIRPAPVGVADALGSARETRALLIGAGILARVPAVFRENFPGARAIVICDATTWRVAGQAVQAELLAADQARPEPFVFRDPSLYAEHRFVAQLEEALALHDAVPVAVGSGTINDLVKLAAHRAGRSYLCVATAASMDGYTAFGASITFRGAKQTFNCPAPRAVVADIDVIRRAPPEMTASGYADLQAKITAGADWLLADALGVEPIESRAWTIVQGGLEAALADPAGARAGQPAAVTPLVEGLMLGGFAMQWTKSSRPASGAEHQFSHLWDMEHHTHAGVAPSHGFKVGIATLAVTTLYEQLLARPLQQLDVDACCAAWPDRAQLEADVRRRFADTDFVETAVQESLAKHASRDELRAQLLRAIALWPDLRPQLAAQLVSSRELRRRLQLAGAPTMPEEIGLTRERLRASFVRAYHLRRRFTVLDIAVRTGLLDRCLETLFAPTGPWGAPA
ncbi:MAG: sn-glycerol-1-phosphate dehydrogenase [Opitutae bacterium]|nr:sn-glycerol-1-phosphate dehydrogenase [Opitutae bacterium]